MPSMGIQYLKQCLVYWVSLTNGGLQEKNKFLFDFSPKKEEDLHLFCFPEVL